MIKKVYILTLLIFGFAAVSSSGQGAQATMRVSVRVISGNSVEMDQPGKVVLNTNQESRLGNLTLRGIDNENVLVNNATKITLRDRDGRTITLNISSSRHQDSNNEHIRYSGISREEMISSIYSGNLTTTIQYL